MNTTIFPCGCSIITSMFDDHEILSVSCCFKHAKLLQQPLSSISMSISGFQKESDELRACPFCGNEARWWVDTSGCRDRNEIGCSNGCVQSFNGDALEWNTRPIEDALRSEVERLRKAMDELKKQV